MSANSQITKPKPQTAATTTRPTATRPTILLTREGEQELRDKLEALRYQIDIDLPRRLRSAREFGEATENDDYLQIREEEAVSKARLAALTEVLAAAEVVDTARSRAGVATIGSTVVIRVGGKTVERRLVGDYEAVGADGFSASSPIGSAILGRSEGETVAVELPNGETRDLLIVAVRN